jgi:uncharacterized membrane protein YkvI
MEKVLNNITKIVTYLIMALAVVFTFWTMSQGDDLKTDAALANKVLNPYFLLTLITLIIGAAGAILFPIGQLATSPKSAIRAGISIAILAGVYLISYTLASGSTAEEYYQTFNISEGMSKFIGSLIYVVYILGSLAVLSIIVSSVFGIISKR